MIRHWLRRLLYRIYLRLPWWRFVRRLALRHYGEKCAVCGSRHALQVHHRVYRRAGRSVLWRERMGDLAVLCRAHHAAQHGRAV